MPHTFSSNKYFPLNENVSMDIKNVSMEILPKAEKSDRIPQDIKKANLPRFHPANSEKAPDGWVRDAAKTLE